MQKLILSMHETMKSTQDAQDRDMETNLEASFKIIVDYLFSIQYQKTDSFEIISSSLTKIYQPVYTKRRICLTEHGVSSVPFGDAGESHMTCKGTYTES